MRRLLNKLVSNFRSTNAARTARRARPAVELLEDRLTPTVVFLQQLGAEAPVPGHNGPTLSNTPVTLIFEGSYWLNPTGITENDVIQSAQNVLSSSYLSLATQYGTNGQAFYRGADTDNSMQLSNGAFDEGGLQNVAASYVKEGLNAPSARGLYLVITAPGVSDGTRPDIGTGYHSELTYSLTYSPFRRFVEEVPFAWVGTATGTRQFEVDNFSGTFSHELVESVTDPYIWTNDANRFTHGAHFQTNETYDEVADFEPNDQHYTYRLGNGTVVQAYWSQKHQQFVVPDGTTQAFTLTPQYGNAPGTPPNQNDFLGSFDLTVNGDQPTGRNDQFTVDTANSGGVRVTLNGESASFDPAKLGQVTLNTLTGNDAVNVENLPANVGTLTVNLGAGNDAVTLGQVHGQLDGIAGHTVTINGGGSNSTLTLNDTGTRGFNVGNFAILPSVDWYFMGNSIKRSNLVQTRNFGESTYQTFKSTITYSGLGQINLSGGNCPDSYFLTTDALSTPLNVLGTGANNQLYFDDGANRDNAGTVYTLTAGQITRVGTDVVPIPLQLGGPGHITIVHHTAVQYSNVPAVNVDGGATPNVVDVNGIGANTGITLFAGTAANTINVGSATSSLDAIQGSLSVLSSGADTLVLNDAAEHNYVGVINSVAFTVSGNSVVRTNTETVRPSPASITAQSRSFTLTNTATISYDDLHSLVIEGGQTGNTFTVQGTRANTPTTIDAGAGSDAVSVLGTNVTGPLTVNGAAGNLLVRVGSVAAFPGDNGPEHGRLANIQGSVNVHNGAGTATLVIDDSGDPTAYTGVSVASGSLTGLGGAAAIHWSGTPTRLYLGGTAGQAGNTLSVDASVSGGLPEVFTGPGNDTVNVLNPSVNNTLTVHGEGGNDTVNLIDPDAADASYAFDGSTLTRTGHNADGTVSGVFTLLVNGIANVQVNSVAI